MLNQVQKTHRIPDSSLRSILEWSAVITNLLFTVLYLNQSEWAFPLGIIGPLLLLLLSWREKLYAEPVLQIVYIISAIVGWYNVQTGWKSWQVGTHLQATFFVLSVLTALIWGYALKRYTRANFPLQDAFIASWGMLATWLMMYQVHACWLYLMAVNTLSLFVYFRRRLYAASFMFALYLVMAIDGYFMLNWFSL
ncbi:MAG: nicotinamide riboside transporter PnuC [Flavobacteriales bacterium]